MTELFITIPRTIEGLEQAAEQIPDLVSREVLLDVIRVRKKWSQIRREYYQMRRDGVPMREAVELLSGEYYYSEKTIEAIIYGR